MAIQPLMQPEPAPRERLFAMPSEPAPLVSLRPQCGANSGSITGFFGGVVGGNTRAGSGSACEVLVPYR